MAGVYDGERTIGELAERGDFGLGTINGVDGELVVLDGTFYSVKVDGRAHRLGPDVQTPFATVGFFSQPQLELDLDSGLDAHGIERAIDASIPDRNALHAIRVDGRFRRLLVRSEPKQQPPYRPLAEVMGAQQRTFELGATSGTLVGFRLPDSLHGINVPGYHFHYLSDDRARGGHVLALELESGRARIDTYRRLELELPDTKEFHALDGSKDRSHELRSVEHGTEDGRETEQ